MSTPLTNDTKNNLSITNNSKADNTTWANHTETWAETGSGGAQWSDPGLTIARETKNSLSISNQTKN